MSGFPELLDSRAEFEFVREATEQVVLTELASGRAARVPAASGSAKRSAATIAAGWDHANITTEPLVHAAAECEAFPKPSTFGTSLVARARMVVSVREALLEASWASASSWAALSGALDLGSRLLSPDDLAALDEITEARAEFEDARAATETALSDALEAGRSTRTALAAWDHSGIAVESLERAIAEVLAFPRPSEAGKAAVKNGQCVVAVRQALVKCDWAKAATWAALVKVLDAVPAEQADLAEAAAARQELLEKQEATMAAVRAAMEAGGCVKSAAGGWDHNAIETAPLQAAIDECAAFPRPHAESAMLLAHGRLCVRLRKALVEVLPEKPATWQKVVALLMGIEGVEELALPEIKGAWLEFREAREAAVKAVDAALRDGCSRPTGGSKPWDHTHLDAETLVRACMQLEAFPKIDAGAAPKAAANGAGPKNPRMSLAQGAVAADNLTAAARRLAKLRQMLLAEAWDDVHKFVGSLSSDVSSLPELASEEVLRSGEAARTFGSLRLPSAPFGSFWLPAAPFGSFPLPSAPFSSLRLPSAPLAGAPRRRGAARHGERRGGGAPGGARGRPLRQEGAQRGALGARRGA